MLLTILDSGSPTPSCWRDLGRRRRNKTELKQKQRWTRDCPISETICSPSDRNTGGIKAACSSLCAPALSGLLSGGEIQRQRSNLHYKLHMEQLKKLPGNSFARLSPLWRFGKNTKIQLCNLFCGEKVFSYADNLPISE